MMMLMIVKRSAVSACEEELLGLTSIVVHQTTGISMLLSGGVQGGGAGDRVT
jgi:hypothetical protein